MSDITMTADEKQRFREDVIGLCRAAFGPEWKPHGLSESEFGPAFQTLPEQFRLFYEIAGREPRLREKGYVDPVDYEGKVDLYPRHVLYRSRVRIVRNGRMLYCIEPSFYYDDNIQFAGLLRYLFPFWPDEPEWFYNFQPLCLLTPGYSGCIGRSPRDEASASLMLSGDLLAELGDSLSAFFPCAVSLERRVFRGKSFSDAVRLLGFTPVEGADQVERSYAYDTRMGLLRFSASDNASWTAFGMRPEAFQEMESFAKFTWLKKDGIWCQAFRQNGDAPVSFVEHLELLEKIYYPHGHRRCTEEELNAAEERLDCRFPEPLRLFYRYFGNSKKLFRASERMLNYIDGDLLKLYTLSELQCAKNRERQGRQASACSDPILAYHYDVEEPDYYECCGLLNGPGELRTRWLRVNRESGKLYWDYYRRCPQPFSTPLEDFLLEQLIDRASLVMPFFRFFTVTPDRNLPKALSAHFLYSEKYRMLLNPERGILGVGHNNWYFYAQHRDDLDRLEEEFGILLHHAR